eukprot:TRINITY_DN7138_c0_g1_i20.p1 TRINITY_DN7138_c0_g1~~TRINITY_DN7138_c0_g1_i20.p1  ORF type:complete len:433 (+),score=153.18 TRINITY_DN7138_c0_g1_i20:933-2231(+)
MLGLHVTARDSKRLWRKLKEKIKNNSLKSDSHPLPLEENDYYKDLGLELGNRSHFAHFKEDLGSRVGVYEKQLEESSTPVAVQYGAQQSYVLRLISDYGSLTSTSERNKRECLRQLEAKIAEESLASLDGVDLEEAALNQVRQKLGRTREARFIQRQKLVNEAAFSQAWTDVETLNLLKGIAKCGERAWSDVFDKYNFQSFRTPNSLAHRWSQMKMEMLEDIQRMYSARNIVITKWDWIQGLIHKLEVKCGYFVGQQPASKLPQSSWSQKSFLWPTASQQARATSLAPDHSTVKPEPFDAREKNGQESVVASRKANVIQQVCSRYEDCLKKFEESISQGSFSVEEVRKYIASKEPAVYPKYFELHYVGQREEPRRQVFKLESKENAKRMPEADERTNEQPLSLKKLFLQKKKAQLNDPVAKEELVSPDSSNN